VSLWRRLQDARQLSREEGGHRLETFGCLGAPLGFRRNHADASSRRQHRRHDGSARRSFVSEHDLDLSAPEGRRRGVISRSAKRRDARQHFLCISMGKSRLQLGTIGGANPHHQALCFHQSGCLTEERFELFDIADATEIRAECRDRLQ
jgi:hypothetical protein